MRIYACEATKTFHLQNDTVSYIMKVLPGGHLSQLYFGKRLRHQGDFDYLLEPAMRSHSAYPTDDGQFLSLEHVKQEYPGYGSGDFRQGAVEVLQENGSRLSDFVYTGYEIFAGKPKLEGLPATYVEEEGEASTLAITLEDRLSGLGLRLLYTIFAQGGVIARSAKFLHQGTQPLYLTRAMSLCLDLPDADYEWMHFSGAWSRERYPVCMPLSVGVHSVESLRGHSSHHQNPFLVLKRPHTGEESGEAIGISFLYSGNFLASVEVDNYNVTRVLMGIHPTWFTWKLMPGEAFQTPEAVLVYSDQGLNGMSRDLHRLYRSRLARGIWRDRPRPILINNWEATYFDFNEEKLLSIARKAKECGVELFVLDDGWFGARRSDFAGLGDWTACRELLPEGIRGISEKVEALGMKFGLWIEPEMVNPDSDLYREHPDWALQVPGRTLSLSRHQLVLDFSRPEVVDYIYGMIYKVLKDAKISYIKWDMNRSLTECYSAVLPADRQGEVFHRYVLGVYEMYERLNRDFPELLLESCAGGGGRFDAGMLYYAPQAWTSDDTDAMERVKIQYGSSYGYPLVSMGSHVSAVPNHQVGRVTSLKTRAEVACFGTYGYELDLNRLTPAEQIQVRLYTAWMKEYRQLLQFGDFYRLASPFAGNESGWMVVSRDRREAIVGYYRLLAKVNAPFTRLMLQGLNPELRYEVKRTVRLSEEELDELARIPVQEPEGTKQAFWERAEDGEQFLLSVGSFYGDALMQVGLVTSDGSAGIMREDAEASRDFSSTLYVLRASGEEED